MSPEYMQALMAGATAPVQQQSGRVKRTNKGLVLTDKPRGRGGFATSLISEASGTGGAVGGAALGATVGSVVPILGTAVGGIIGAGVGGFLGGTVGRGIENKVRDDQNFLGEGGSAKSAYGEGAISGVLGAAGQGFQALKGAKAAKGAVGATDDLVKTGSGLVDDTAKLTTPALKTSTTGKLNDMGNKALVSQYGTISKPVSRASDPVKTIGQLADFGITKPVDAERIATAITGSDGILNKVVVNSVRGSGTVKVNGVESVLQKAITTNGLVDKDAKAVSNVVTAQLKAINEGGGSADSVLSAMKSLEKRIANLQGKGSNYALATPERLDQANALKAVKNELQDRLYKIAGADKNLPANLTPELRNSLVSLNPGNAKWQNYVDNTIMKSKDIKSIRNAQSPFVKIKNIIDDADLNSITFGGRASGFSGGTIGSRLLDTGTEYLKNPVMRGVARPLKAVGTGAERFAGTTGKVSGVIKPATRFAGGMAARGIADNMLNPSPTNLEDALLYQSNGPNTVNSAYSTNPMMSDTTMMPANSSNIDGLYQDGTDMSSPFSPENVDANVQNILANGGDLKDVQDYVSLVDAITQIKGAGQSTKPLSAEASKTQSNALAGLEAINDFQTAIESNPSGFRNTIIPGRNLLGGAVGNALGTNSIDASSQQIIDVIARLRTGAAISREEEQRFKQFIPRPGDSPEVRQQKLGYLSRQFQRVAGSVGSGGLEDALMQYQGSY